MHKAEEAGKTAVISVVAPSDESGEHLKAEAAFEAVKKELEHENLGRVALSAVVALLSADALKGGGPGDMLKKQSEKVKEALEGLEKTNPNFQNLSDDKIAETVGAAAAISEIVGGKDSEDAIEKYATLLFGKIAPDKVTQLVEKAKTAGKAILTQGASGGHDAKVVSSSKSPQGDGPDSNSTNNILNWNKAQVDSFSQKIGSQQTKIKKATKLFSAALSENSSPEARSGLNLNSANTIPTADLQSLRVDNLDKLDKSSKLAELLAQRKERDITFLPLVADVEKLGLEVKLKTDVARARVAKQSSESSSLLQLRTSKSKVAIHSLNNEKANDLFIEGEELDADGKITLSWGLEATKTASVYEVYRFEFN